MVDLRVLMVAAAATPGLARHVRVLADHAGRRGVAVTVCADRPQDLGLGGTGARLVTLPVGTSPVQDALLLRTLRREATRHDLVHAFDLRAGAVAAAAVRPPQPLVVTCRTGAARTLPDAVERFALRRASTVLCVSQDLAERARSLGAREVHLRAPSSPVVDRPPRSRVSVRAELAPGPRSSEPQVVLSVGRLVPAKGHRVLVDAAAQMVERAPVPLFLVAGDGPERADLERRVERTGAPVRLLGRRPDVPDLLRASDLLVVPSLADGVPTVVGEALRAGVPVVASDVGGIGETAGAGALLVAPGDADDLARTIGRVLDDARLATAMRGHASEAAQHLPTDDAVGADVLSHWHRLMLAGTG